MKTLVRSVFLFCCFLSILFGKTVSTSASGVWSAAGTWQGGIVPAASDTVIISSGHTVTVDTNYTVAKITIQGNAIVQYDGYLGDVRRLTSNGDFVIEANGILRPSGPFVTGDAYTRIDILGSLIVDGVIEYSVKGSTSGTRIMQYIMMTNTGPATKNVTVQGTGKIEAGYFQVNKSVVTDTVTIMKGITVLTDYIYIYKGTLDNTVNSMSTYICTRFDNASVFMTQPVYRSKSNAVAYLGSTNITAGNELPDTVHTFTTQNPAKYVRVMKDLVVTGQLNLSDGRVEMEKYQMKVNGSVLNSGFGGKGFVSGWLEKPVLSKNDSVRIFEVGSSGGYAEAKVEFLKLYPKGSLAVRTVGAMHEYLKDTTVALRRYWTFSVNDSLLFKACNVTVRYAAADFVNALNESKNESLLIVAQYDKVKGDWIYPTISKRDTAGAGGTIEVTGLETLSDIVLLYKENTVSVPQQSLLPQTMELFQNYPNPFNPSTVIDFRMPAQGHVLLTVYDAIGREIAVLVNGVREAGTHSATFDGSKLSTGVYFARLQDGKNVQLKKMLMVQ